MKCIKYQLMTEINFGTEEEPKREQVFSAAEIRTTEKNFDANYALAEKEAWNGEITVEEISGEETAPTTEERVAELEEAVAAGLKLYEEDLGNG